MDKNKIIEAAAKLVAKGAYDKAIKEYQRILDVDPKDVRILQKMGELCQKKNDTGQAAQYFTRVAESYTNDGFFLKAVALYKQVLKLDPSLIDVNIKLAELHQHLQLIGEAMAYYQMVANHHDKQGNARASLEVLKKMVELEPDNVASRVKLADLYVREGLSSEAKDEFNRAAEFLKRNNRIDDYLRVAERIASVDPNNLVLARELAELYLQRNDQKRALAKLQVCFNADRRDIETLKLLAVAFQGLGQTSKTISVYKELGRAYEDRGRLDDAEKTWAQVEQLDPNDPDVRARLVGRSPVVPPPAAAPPPQAPPHGLAASPVSSSPTAAQYPGGPVRGAPPGHGPAPAPVPAPQPPIPSTSQSSALRSPKESLAKLLTETDVYVKYGLHDKALEHLRKVFAVEPENIDAHEKAYAIYVASGNRAQAFEQLLNVLRLHTRSPDPIRARPFLAAILEQNPNHPEVQVFLSALQSSGELVASAVQEGVGEDAILVDSNDDEVIVAEEPIDEVISAEIAVVTGEEVVQDDALDLAGQIATNPDDFVPVADSEGDLQVVADFESQYQQPIPLQTITEGLGPPELGAEDHDAPTGAAPSLGESMEQASRDSPPPMQQVEWSSGQAPDSGSPPEEEPAAEEYEEASFFCEQGLYEEAREILETILIAYPEHARAAALLAQLDAPRTSPEGAGSQDAFNLAAELAGELGELGDLGEVAGDGSTGGTGEYQVSVEEVFAEFKKGLEKVVKPEDVETHYDLGVAYKEMALVDDAVNEFSIARKGCAGKRKEVDCLSMVGLLEMSRGAFAAAVGAFEQALASEHATGDTEKALRYELATALEGAGQLGRALGQFLRVEKLDGSFRDVANHVARLSEQVAPEDEAAAERPRRKVGYV